MIYKVLVFVLFFCSLVSARELQLPKKDSDENLPDSCVLIFTGNFCAPCKQYCKELDSAGIDYYVVDVASNLKLSRKWKVVQPSGNYTVPRTLIFHKGKSYLGDRLTGTRLYQLRKFHRSR